MNEKTFKIRLMEVGDFDAVVEIDRKLLNVSRREYYEVKFQQIFETQGYLPASLVAETEDGTVAGFIMGELYIGEFGIFQERAELDTIGVDPDYQHKGIGKLLIDEFVDHLQRVGVEKVNTLLDYNSPLIHFFDKNEFSPSKTINLERSI